MSTWERLAGLPLQIDSYSLEGLSLQLPAFQRLSTVIALHGAGHDGIGEDPTYDPDDHKALQAAGAPLPLAGDHTLQSFSDLLGTLDLFPAPTSREVSRKYRRWAFEAAALDLALRQAGTALAAALGMQARPLTFVVSMGLGDPSDPGRARELLERDPSARFKLDAAEDWDETLIAELAATGAVASVDLKGLYEDTPVDLAADPELYRRVAEGFPDAWIEDPKLNDETDPALAPYRDRITWDEPIHSVADIEGLAFKPQMLNFKPCRFGALSELFAAYDHCAAQRIGIYGGGSLELGPGRSQIQHLAALFHPDAPNDTAPSEFNLPQRPDELPTSPLPAPGAEPGFR